MHSAIVWLAEHPAVWVVAVGVLCSLAYRKLDAYPRWHAVFRVVAAGLPGDIVAIRKAVLELVEVELARKAGVDPVAFAARKNRRAFDIATPESFPPVESTPAVFPAHWEDQEKKP